MHIALWLHLERSSGCLAIGNVETLVTTADYMRDGKMKWPSGHPIKIPATKHFGYAKRKGTKVIEAFALAYRHWGIAFYWRWRGLPVGTDPILSKY